MADAGMDVPAISERPVSLGYEWLWEAFIHLTGCRSGGGMSLLPIPWWAIEMYAKANHLNADEKYLLHIVIPEMDRVFLEHVSKKHGN